MSPRVKKLIGMLLMLAWIALYAVVAAGFGALFLPRASWYGQLIYYALAGTLWIVPVGLMLPWMYREPKKP
ncbi:MAG TPA: DUF2842 domain-containing protein [Rhizomicrobium sp.]|nr:DUF2842 domain-containing protein [Rhizomicrobium sp.]